MRTSAIPAREQLARLPLRECVPCRIWTECGRCPDCGASLGPPPYAASVRPEEFDFAPAPPPRAAAATSCWWAR